MSRTAEKYHALVGGRSRGAGAAIVRGLLRAASWPYGWAVAVRNKLFDWGWKAVRRADVPVVSVGNLTLGGTGKTPCVEYICRFFRERELRVAILSRGYGAEQGPNDEALVLEENLPDVPHLQGKDRAALAQTAVEELESEILVLDDGFQHRRLARNLDVVLIDATCPWGHGYLFPRGLLRESPRSLRRAGVIVVTRCDQATAEQRAAINKSIARLAPGVPMAEATHGPVELIAGDGTIEPLTELCERPVSAFCGIGNPQAFRRTLTDLGADLSDFRPYPDHHGYTREDINDLRRWAGEQPSDALIATTQKDLVKICLTHLAERPLRAVRISMQPFAEGSLDALDERLQVMMDLSASRER